MHFNNHYENNKDYALVSRYEQHRLFFLFLVSHFSYEHHKFVFVFQCTKHYCFLIFLYESSNIYISPSFLFQRLIFPKSSTCFRIFQTV